MSIDQSRLYLNLLSKLQDIIGVQISSNFDPELVPTNYHLSENGRLSLLFQKNLNQDLFSLFNRVEVRKFEGDPRKANFSIISNIIDEYETVKEVGNKIITLFGKDDNQNGMISDEELIEINVGNWSGRSWLSDIYQLKLMMNLTDKIIEITLFLNPK